MATDRGDPTGKSTSVTEAVRKQTDSDSDNERKSRATLAATAAER